MELKKAIGARIRRVRYNVGVNQKTFAKMIGVSTSSQSAYEQGDVMPPISTLIMIADQGKVSLDWLILGRG